MLPVIFILTVSLNSIQLLAGSVNTFSAIQTFYQALRSRDSLQLEYTDCLLDKNRLRKRIAELQANLEQQERELEREREGSREQMEQSTSCLHCVSEHRILGIKHSLSAATTEHFMLLHHVSVLHSPTCLCAVRTSATAPAVPLDWT